jgi:hypothetical protein
MKQIALTQGKVTRVSDHWFEFLNQWKWYATRSDKTWYAVRNSSGPNRKKILMHRVITDAPDGVEVDHWDRDGLNNTDENLRLASRSQNNENKARIATNRSGFKGVYFDKRAKKYAAKIFFFMKRHWLGYYNTPEDAAIAYNHAALELFGEFASFNEIPDWQSRVPQAASRSNATGYRGVNWITCHKKWKARIGWNGRRIHIGYFDDPEAAARAYDAKAEELFGPFARKNF